MKGRSVRSEETLQFLPWSLVMFLLGVFPLQNQDAQGTNRPHEGAGGASRTPG